MKVNTFLSILSLIALVFVFGCNAGNNARAQSFGYANQGYGTAAPSAPSIGSSPFNKDYINPKLSCVGIQLLDSGKLELQSPSKEARDAFYRVHGNNLAQIIAAVHTIGASYDGQCTHRNSTNSGNWLPICRLRVSFLGITFYWPWTMMRA